MSAPTAAILDDEPDTVDPFRSVAEALRAAAAAVEALGSIQPPQAKDRALSLREVCQLTGRGRTFAYGEIEKGRLRARVMGGDLVVLLTDLQDYLRNLRVRRPGEVRRVRRGNSCV